MFLQISTFSHALLNSAWTYTPPKAFIHALGSALQKVLLIARPEDNFKPLSFILYSTWFPLMKKGLKVMVIFSCLLGFSEYPLLKFYISNVVIHLDVNLYYQEAGFAFCRFIKLTKEKKRREST